MCIRDRNGTLMLQEIDTLSYTVQSNVYQAMRYHRVIQRNLERSIHVNARLIATTEADLWDTACSGGFRMDLYYPVSYTHLDVYKRQVYLPCQKAHPELPHPHQYPWRRFCWPPRPL